MSEKKQIRDRFNPLYIPLLTAIPAEAWLLYKQPPYVGVELTLYIIAILFLVFSGAVETSSEETKHRIFGYVYLISALMFGVIGLWMWLG
ncbi:hypothetical protein EQV77_10380 [Halobacillus fulvus]|nr:hypothetical protein EQV77_10380 [Halobacillus fulvus]